MSSVAHRAGINPIDLKFFHNDISHFSERIYFENLSNYDFIYIPIDYQTEIDKKSERPSKESPIQFYFPQYSVEETFSSDDDIFSIDYLIDIHLEKDKGANIISIHSKDFKKNGEKPDDKISSLALECVKSIYPLAFILSDNGQITSFFDHQNSINRFQQKRPEIEEYHIGETSKNYLDTFELSIKNEAYFLDQLKNKPLYQFLFPKRDWFHATTSWEESLLIDGNYIPKLIEFTANYNHDNRTFVETTIQGKSIDDDMLMIVYKTNKITKKLFKVSVKITQSNDVSYQLKIQQPS